MQQWLRELSKDAFQHVLLPGSFQWRLPRQGGGVALTFDDGPHPEHTPAMLDLLDRLGIRGTFFVIGRQVDAHPDVVAEVVRRGHVVAAHGYAHTSITQLDAPALAADLQQCRSALGRCGAPDSVLFRPPRGEVSIGSMWRVSRLGWRIVHWTKTYSDYQCDGVEPLVRRLQADPPRAGDILLFHDHNPYTVKALEQVLPQWQRSGLRFQAL